MKLTQVVLRDLFWLVLVAASLALVGCLPEFENALADQTHFDTDERILGAYDDFKIRLPDAKTGIYEFVHEGRDPVPFRLLKVGEMHFMCLSKRSFESAKGSVVLDMEPTTVAYLYEVESDGRVSLFDWNQKKLIKAIESKALSGTVERTGHGKVRRIVISSPAPEVRAWLKANGRAAFDAKATVEFTRP